MSKELKSVTDAKLQERIFDDYLQDKKVVLNQEPRELSV